MVDPVIGAYSANAQRAVTCKVFYWREGNYEIDFVVQAGRSVTAIEVRSGRVRGTLTGMDAFSTAFKRTRKLLVGGDGISTGEFLEEPVPHWVG